MTTLRNWRDNVRSPRGGWRLALVRAVVTLGLLFASTSFARRPIGEARAALDAGKSAAEHHQAVGVVRAISDGDACHVVIDGVSTRVRLAEIDAPEKTQPFGRRAEQALREFVWKREVRVTWSEVDRYGRPIVQITVDGRSVNAELVRQGYAWVYLRYSSNAELVALEAEAKKEGGGLWADAHPISPWEWRNAHKTTAQD